MSRIVKCAHIQASNAKHDGSPAEIKEAMIAADLTPEHAEVTMRADVTSPLELDDAEKMIRLLDHLEDLDDVQNVYSNADISEEILKQLG